MGGVTQIPGVSSSTVEISQSSCNSYEEIEGTLGSSDDWGSGWIDLRDNRNFEKGQKIVLKVGGTAENIVVRFLPVGTNPGSPRMILKSGSPPSPIIEINDSRLVEITINKDYTSIQQISVHGGPKVFGIYDLGEDNGSATLVSVSMCGE